MKIRFRRKKGWNASSAWVAKLAARERVFRLKIAEKLRRRAARLTPAQLRWWAGLLFSVGFMVYTWIGIRALWKPQKPVDFIETAVAPTPMRVTPFYREEREIFRDYLDSINANPVLKKCLDSLRAARPGFADTIRRLEGIYPGF